MIDHDERVYVLKKATEGWRPDLVNQRPRPRFEAMIWGGGVFFRSYPGEVTTVNENIIAIRYQGSICKIYIHLHSKKNYAGYPIK